MSEQLFFDSEPFVRVYPEAVRRNWERIVRLEATAPAGYVSPSGWPANMAVIKADAYGHGIVPVSKALFAAGARAFGVGSVAEGAALANALPELGAASRILPLLGVKNTNEADLCIAHSLTPFIHRPGQALMLAARCREAGVSGPLDIALKMDTGLCRLGFSPEALPALLEELAACPELRPSLLLSHYASADVPDECPAWAAQTRTLVEDLAAFRSRWPDITPSITNSPGTLNARALVGADVSAIGPSMARPGVALYGVNPFAGSGMDGKGKGFFPAMEAVTSVLEVKDIPAGARVSYAHTFTAPRTMRIAVIAAGYADGMSRGLSGKGSVCIRGMRAPRIGRVCMQMHMVDVSHIPGCIAGDAAYILGGPGESFTGGGIGVQEVADAWGTIAHEVTCILGGNRREVMEGLAPGTEALVS